MATGQASFASGDNSTAAGQLSTASGADSTALGQGSVASGTDSTAVGQGSQATHDNAMALGAGAQTTAANQVIVGGATNTYTTPGIASAASRAAQTGPVELVTTDLNGNLASDGGATAAAIRGLNEDVRENRDGVAMALAMQSPSLAGAENFALSGGFGAYAGGSAFAATGAVRISPNAQLDGGIGVGFRENRVGGRIGVTFKW